MKQCIAVLLIIFTVQSSVGKQVNELYLIRENGRWGYIDNNGTIIIKPVYHSAGNFSEGLAPVRLNGTYGYINTKGDFVIAPQYDVAYSFDRGQAKVYLDSIPYYINREGEKTFEHSFAEISGFEEKDVSIVITKSGKYGVINRKGRLVADTIFQQIHPFSDNIAIVYGLNHDPYPDDKNADPVLEAGVINTEGKFIVPFGKYKGISRFENGFARVDLNVERQSDFYDNQGIIDINGNLKFTIPAKKWHFDYRNGAYSEGLATIAIYTKDPNSIKVWSSKDRNTYKGVVDTEGNIIFSNENWDEITPFRKNRAFIKDTNKDWYLINKEGRILTRVPYKDVLYDNYNEEEDYFYSNGIQFVQTSEGWGAIDTNGQYVIEPKEMVYNSRDLTRRGSILITKGLHNNSYVYGFWDTKNDIIVKPEFHQINLPELNKDLIYTLYDGRIGYIDHKGNYVWREKEKDRQNYGKLNIDFMNRGYFYASSPYKKELNGYGGWGGSGNDFKEISASKHSFGKDEVKITVKPGNNVKYQTYYDGMNLYLSNTSSDTLYFDAQDSRLYLKLQAQDKNGDWKDIEYLPSSWCGNSYHDLFLPPQYYWEFVIPVYDGEFKTRLRAELLYKKDPKQQEIEVLYSHEFDGSINPGQFWRKSPYYPAGIMDPYLE